MKTEKQNGLKKPKKVKPQQILIVFLGIVNLAGLFLVWRQLNQLAQYSSLDQSQNQALGPAGWERTAEIPKVFLNEKGVIEFVSAITQAQSNFDQFSLRFDSDLPLTNKTQPYLPLTLTFSGSLGKTQSFLDQLLNARCLLETVNFEAKSKDSFVNQVEMIIRADLYVSEEF